MPKGKRLVLKRPNPQAYKLGLRGYDDKVPVRKENKSKGKKNNRTEVSQERVNTEQSDIRKPVAINPMILSNELTQNSPESVRPWRVNFLKDPQSRENSKRLVSSSSLRADTSSTKPTETGNTLKPRYKENPQRTSSPYRSNFFPLVQ